jgi:hypothetical protein
LRGAGVTLALPLLDSMIPAFASPSDKRLPVRMAFVYVPNGIMMEHWTPQTEGAGFETTRLLKPLEAYKKDMLVLTGLAHKTGAGGGGDHARAGGTYLTGVRPNRSTTIAEVGISVDQVAAQAIGGQTRFPSLEMGCEIARTVGSCDSGYSCAYVNNMAWRGPSTPLPPEINPRLLFERLYGTLDTSADPAVRGRLKQNRRSVLDFVNARTRALMNDVGPADRQKIDQYTTAIREIEKRIQKVEAANQELAPTMEKPSGIPATFPEHVRLMHDLMVVAFQADLTRVSTLMYSREGSTRSYPETGFTDGHHTVSHHGNKPELMEKVAEINLFHVQQFADLVAKLKAVPEGDGNLLDNSIIVYGSSLSDGNKHSHENLPTLVLGRAGGGLNPGRHIRYTGTPPMTNLFLTLLDRMGVKDDKLGDSNGKVEHLSDV